MSRILEHKVNVYNSVEITDSCTLKRESRGPVTDPIEFESVLWHSLQKWKKEGRKGTWLKIHVTAAELIPAAVRAGFQFHHADQEYLTLSAWLSPLENKLPPGPGHFIGVAGMVLNSKGEVLSIREKSGPSVRLADFWKLPGGLVDKHEDLRQGAVREVFEETGIETEFVSLATIQEIHHGDRFGGPARSGTTDLYCICILKPLNENQEIKMQTEEISACRWLPLQDFLDIRYYSQQGTLYQKMYQTAAQVALNQSQGLEAENLPFGMVQGTNTLYSPALKQNSKL